MFIDFAHLVDPPHLPRREGSGGHHDLPGRVRDAVHGARREGAVEGAIPRHGPSKGFEKGRETSPNMAILGLHHLYLPLDIIRHNMT